MNPDSTEAVSSRPYRRGWQEIGATVVLMSAVAALGYVLVSERHSRELDDLRTTWSGRIRAIEAKAAAAEDAAGKLSSQASRLAAELPALSAARDELQKKLTSAEATIAKDRAQAHRDIAQAEEMNATLRRELEAVLEEYTKALVDADRDLQRLSRERDEAFATRDRLQDELAQTKAAYAQAEAEASEIVARLVEVFPALANNLPQAPSEPKRSAPGTRLAEQPPAPSPTPEATPASGDAARGPSGLLPLVRQISHRNWREFIQGTIANLERATQPSATVGAGPSSRAAVPAESF